MPHDTPLRHDSAASPVIAVFGSSTLPPDAPACDAVRALGGALAARGAVVVSGGYAGIMGAVSEGARAAGGAVVGVTLARFTDRSPNRWLTDEVPSPDLWTRLRTLTEGPDAYVVAAGNLGTLTELFLTWNLAMLHEIPPRPIVLLGEHWHPFVAHLRESGLVPDAHLAMLAVAEDAAAAEAALAPVWEQAARAD